MDRDRERERERIGERTGYDQGWKTSDRGDREQRELKDRDRDSVSQGSSYLGGRDRYQQQDYYQSYPQQGVGQQQQQQQYGLESRRDFSRYSPYDTLRGGQGAFGEQQKTYQWQPERYSFGGSGSGFGYGQEFRYPVLGGGIQYQQYPSQYGLGGGSFGSLPGGYPENVSFGQNWFPSRGFQSGGFRDTPFFGGGAGAGSRDLSYGGRLGYGEQELGGYGGQGLSGAGFGYDSFGLGHSSSQTRGSQHQQNLYKQSCGFSGKESCDINLADVTGVFYPNVDIYEDRNNMYLDFELPGIKREDVYLHIAGAEDHRVLNVSGVVRDKPFASLDARYLQKNRKTGRFKLKIHLPDNIRTEEISADLTDGILTATIPKTEDVSAALQAGVRKRIDITSRLPQFKTSGVLGSTTQEKFGEGERTQQLQSAAPQQAQISPPLGQQQQTQQQLYRPGSGYTAQT